MTGQVRVYRGDAIAVSWNPERCIHTANCIRALPGVFDPRARPWIQLEGAVPEAIAGAVLRCPTGALHFERIDGAAGETASGQSTITVEPNGPLYVRGDVDIRDPAGGLIRQDTRLALCRCGHSASQPFCDLSHRRVGFVAP